MPCTLVIMAKAPYPGAVKTRLVPVLGPQGAARLAAYMLEQALAQALRARAIVPDLTLELCVAPDATDAYWATLVGAAPVAVTQQRSGDLGERMAAAVARVTARGDYCVLMGSDCLELTAERIAAAVTRLRREPADLVITPARDGGYVLIGMASLHSALFVDMPWSTSRVMALTRQRASVLGLELVCMETLGDIDEPEDLADLPQDAKFYLARP